MSSREQSEQDETLLQTCELQIPWSFLSACSSIASPRSFVLQYEPSDVLRIPGDSINMVPLSPNQLQELGGSKIFSLSVCRTMPSHRDSNLSNSHSDNPAPHSLTFNTMLNYAFNKHIIVNGIVQIFMVMFVRWRQVIHPTANSFYCQHCRGAMLRRKLREGTSHPQNLLYLKSFPKLFGTSKPRGAFCNKLGRDYLKCWNKRCLLNLTIFMLLAAPSTV